jgi:hypothetical protein
MNRWLCCCGTRRNGDGAEHQQFNEVSDAFHETSSSFNCMSGPVYFPERTLLYQTIAEHFETWHALVKAGQFDGRGDHHTPSPRLFPPQPTHGIKITPLPKAAPQ